MVAFGFVCCGIATLGVRCKLLCGAPQPFGSLGVAGCVWGMPPAKKRKAEAEESRRQAWAAEEAQRQDQASPLQVSFPVS